jgi:hypothetical protein
MNLKRWLSVFLMMGLILALNPLGAQARPKYHHPRGNAYGWDGPRHHNFERHQKHFRRSCKGPHHHREYGHYAGPPQVAYVTPVAPIIAMPYQQPQPYYSQPANPGLSGNLNWNF